MASEERYLWTFAYQLHGENRLWWAYFRDGEEARACVRRLMTLFPCVEMLSLEEQTRGLNLEPYACAFCFSEQQEADALHKRTARRRDYLTFPLAPLACAYLSSFVMSLDHSATCSRCELTTPAPVQVLVG